MNQTTLKVLEAMIELQRELPPFGPTLEEVASRVDGLNSRSAVHPHMRELVELKLVSEVIGGDSARKYVADSDKAENQIARLNKALESQIAQREEDIDG